MKITDHFDTHPETGRAMLPPGECEQCDYDPELGRWVWGTAICFCLAFWTAVGVWVVT